MFRTYQGLGRILITVKGKRLIPQFDMMNGACRWCRHLNFSLFIYFFIGSLHYMQKHYHLVRNLCIADDYFHVFNILTLAMKVPWQKLIYCGFINIRKYQFSLIQWKLSVQGYMNSLSMIPSIKNALRWIFNFVDQVYNEFIAIQRILTKPQMNRKSSLFSK